MRKYSLPKINNTKALYSEQLNLSFSKMLYSFPKSARFASQRLDSRALYLPPSSTSKKSTNFGRGAKNNLSLSTLQIPGPSHYEIRGLFRSESRGITFGSSRQKVKYNSYLNEISRLAPGPGQYTPRGLSQKSLKYSIGGKYDIPDHQRGFPGPGSYNTVEILNSEGKVGLSQYRSISGSKFSRLPKLLNSERDVPGPGKYDPNKSIRFLSKYSRAGGCRFMSASKVKGGIYVQKDVPGPGFYNHYTEFHSREP